MGTVPGLLINATCVHREPRGPPTRGVRWDDGLGPHQRGQAPHVVQPKRPPRNSQASAQSRQEAVHVVARDTIESDTARLVLAHGGKGERVDTDRTTYEKAVRDHLARRRQAVPIVPRDALSPLAEGQNRTADTMIFSHVQSVVTCSHSLSLLTKIVPSGHRYAQVSDILTQSYTRPNRVEPAASQQ